VVEAARARGWTLVSGGQVVREDFHAKVWIHFDPPIVWEKPHPVAPERHTLQMTVRGISERDGPWYLTEHRILTDGAESHVLGRSDWAEWSGSGDLLFAKQSALYRLGYSRGGLAPLSDARALIDLKDLTFTPREAPPEALRWSTMQ
jgi:hypothetical protein